MSVVLNDHSQLLPDSGRPYAGACLSQVKYHRGTRRQQSAISRMAEADWLVTILDQIATALAHGERVQLRGFSQLQVSRTDSRVAQSNNQPAASQPKALPFFQTGDELRPAQSRMGMKPAPDSSHNVTTLLLGLPRRSLFSLTAV